MGIYDAMMLAIVVVAVLWGAMKGLAWQIASLAAISVSYLVAVNFRGPVSQYIDAAPPWNTFAAMLILYLGTSLIIWIGFRVVRESIEGMKLKSFDRQLGAIFGGIKGVGIATVVTFFGLTLLTQSQQEAIIHSRSGYYIAKVLNGARMIMPNELHTVLGPYIDQMDQKLDPAIHDHQPGSFTTTPNIVLEPLGQQGTTLPLPGEGGWTTPPTSPRYAQPTYPSSSPSYSQPGYAPPSSYRPRTTSSQPTYSQPTYSPPAPPYGQSGYSPRSARPTYRPTPY